MEQLKKAIYALIATVVVSTALVLITISGQTESSFGASQTNGFYSGNVTATTTTLSLTSGDINDIVLYENSGRKYVEVTNTGGTIAYLAFSSATSSAQVAAIEAKEFTIPLAASGGTYTINYDNLYRGNLIATSTAGVVIRAIEVQ